MTSILGSLRSEDGNGVVRMEDRYDTEQLHLENLAAHIAGREPAGSESRWEELLAAYEALAKGETT